MHAFAGEGVEVDGQSSHQSLAFTGAHLGDVTPMQHDTADDLHREVLHAQHAPAGLAADGVGVGQDVVQGLALGQPLFQGGGHGLQLGIGHGLVLGFQSHHLVGDGLDALELFIGIGTENFI